MQKHGYVFLHSLKGTEYFRTLLNQGGLPVNYIKNSGNIGYFSKFLKELVSELSSINLDWNEVDSSIIQQFNCISYLGKAFRNENIYDVSMQIAHAIIVGEKELLPYDDTDVSLAELTKSLETAYSRARAQRKHALCPCIGNSELLDRDKENFTSIWMLSRIFRLIPYQI